MATATATHHLLHDPFSPHHTHYSPSETTALLDLLATDHLVDSHAPPPAETDLLNDLLAVDLEFTRVDVRDHKNVATALALKDEKDLFLSLLEMDQAVDGANNKTSSDDQHYATSRALHDPYVKEQQNMVIQFAGVYAASVGEGGSGGSDEQKLRDDVVMMHLLAIDESVDDSKRYNKLIQSDEYAIIEDLYMVDREVSGAKNRALLVEDLQGLLDVDHLVDGVKKADVKEANESKSDGGKRSIFSVKEKYSAKLSNTFSS
mmetsp:Transcript_43400/g.77989  ORF Transcript_43400/g.77989 Transcript_43400/m.77989 type:complete len:261 (-) Transcript_43400:307-1089(-)